MPVITCSQRAAKLSHSQKIAKSVMRGPFLRATLRAALQTERGRQREDFQKNLENNRLTIEFH